MQEYEFFCVLVVFLSFSHSYGHVSSFLGYGRNFLSVRKFSHRFRIQYFVYDLSDGRMFSLPWIWKHFDSPFLSSFLLYFPYGSVLVGTDSNLNNARVKTRKNTRVVHTFNVSKKQKSSKQTFVHEQFW